MKHETKIKLTNKKNLKTTNNEFKRYSSMLHL